MAYNKVVFGNDTLIDLTSDTVTENNLVEGVTAHNKSGEAITGTMKVVNISVVASEYSSSSTYSVGDYVIYSNKLYRCTTAISSGEAWNSGHWTEVKVSTELSQLNEDIATKANASDLTAHTGNSNVHVTSSEKNTWNNKGTYSKPSGGIPYSDLASNAIVPNGSGPYEDDLTSLVINGYKYQIPLSGKEESSNKVTSLSSSSTNTQYPSAKCVYDLVGNVEALLEALL